MRTNLLTLALGSRWAIRREAVPMLLSAIQADMRGDAIVGPTQAAEMRQTSTRVGNVAVIPITGVITHRDNWWARAMGWTTIEGLRASLRAAMGDESVSAIVFDCDSPGGTVDGVPEMADEIYEAKSRGTKVILSISNTLNCSACYWLSSQADKVIASPSSDTGSIGVYTMHQDVSGWLEQMGIKIETIFAGKHKVDGHPYAPLSDEARELIQAGVDEVYRDFLAAVARGRGGAASEIKEAYGDGRVFGAREARKLGVVDSIGTLESAMIRVGGRRGRAALAEDWDLPMVAEVTSESGPDQTAIDRDQLLLAAAVMEVEARQ